MDKKVNVEFPDEFWVTNWGLKGVPNMINEQEKIFSPAFHSLKAELEKELKQTTILVTHYKGAMEDCLAKVVMYEKLIDRLFEGSHGQES